MHTHEPPLQWERHLASNICSYDVKPVEKEVERSNTGDDCNNMEWTEKYIPETCLHKGKTFRQQISLLLNHNETQTLKNALAEFDAKRNIDSLLFELYPILSKQDSSCDVIWQYVLIFLTEEEQLKLKTRLFELVKFQLPVADLNNNCATPSQNQSMVTSTTNSKHCKQRCRRNRRSTLTPSDDNRLNSFKNNASGSLPEPSGGNLTSTPARRQRRRRASKNLEISSEICSRVSTLSIDAGNTTEVTSSNTLKLLELDNHKLLRSSGRRQRFSETQKTRHVASGAGACMSTQYIGDHTLEADIRGEPVSSIKTAFEIENQENSQNTKANDDCLTIVTRRERRRSRRASTFVLLDSNGPDILITGQQQDLCDADASDKKKKQRQDSESVTADNSSSPLPASSIDDVIATHSRDQQTEKRNFQTPAAKQAEQSLNGDRKKTPSASAAKQLSNEQFVDTTETDKVTSFRRDTNSRHSCRSPGFDAIFLDNSKHKKNYFNALKKKLPFSSAPKASDTDTFLCELSAQFDSEMNLLDDIQILNEEHSAQPKYGEKWSYLPKADPEPEPEPEFQIATEVKENPLCVTNIDDVINGETPVKDKEPTSNRSVRSSRHRKNSTPISDSSFTNHDLDVPPFPVNLKESPEKNRSMSLRTREETNNLEFSNRSERVRRRRRRNPENIAKRHQIRSEIPEEQDSALQRATESFQSSQKPSNDERFPNPYPDEIIYDIPKPTNQTQPRRAHVNVEKRSRRTRANRKAAMLNKRNSTELRMHVWNENELLEPNTAEGGVRLRSSSPVEQVSFFDKAKKKNYRVSGISIAMEDIFSKAEEDLHNHSFSPAPEISPPMPEELLSTPNNNQDITDPDETYAPLREEVLALGLAYEENAEYEDPQSPDPKTANSNNFTYPTSIPPPPPLPVIPPPPPPPLSPPLMFKNTPPTTPPFKTAVKRINWEKIEPPDLSSTVWGQLGDDHDKIHDVVKYLDLEEHFAMKKAKELKQKTAEVKKDTVNLLAHKKAYNTSILLAHLKLSPRQICECLLVSGSESSRRRMDASHYKQLLMYAPDQEEVIKIKQYNDNISKLNEADLLAKKLVNIPGYQLRLKALMFKHSFSEKEEEIQKNFEVVQRASSQLRKSRKLAKILEFVLAMGNHMNRGHMRIAKATGFRIHFLADIDLTKTSDNKLTFLHILARAVISKFPDVAAFPEEIKDVKAAARVTFPTVVEELQGQRKLWLLIRDNLNKTEPNTKSDKFKIAMETCLVRTNGSLKRLEQLQNATSKEFGKVAKYFGENPKNIAMQQFFKIFDEFTRKFEKSHNEIRNYMKNKPQLRK